MASGWGSPGCAQAVQFQGSLLNLFVKLLRAPEWAHTHRHTVVHTDVHMDTYTQAHIHTDLRGMHTQSPLGKWHSEAGWPS